MAARKKVGVETRPYNAGERQEFADAFASLMEQMGMGDWSWMVRSTELEGDRVAEMRYDPQGRTATACLTTEPVEHTALNAPKRVAAHEAAHLLLADYESICHERFADQKQINTENEKIAIRLECLLERLV